MLRSFKTKLKLDDRQATVMARHAGYSRWIYNWALRLWGEAYQAGLKPSAHRLKKFFTNHIKPLYPWMNELSSKVYQYTFIHLGEAFNRFLTGLGNYPQFKKKGRHDSFTIDNSGKPIQLVGINHKLPFIGQVKTFEPIPECVTKKVTISRAADGWYLSFTYCSEPIKTAKICQAVGVDLGLKTLATLSSGIIFENPKPYKRAFKKIKGLQRKLSRKVKSSENWSKARHKLARAHQKVTNIRKNTLHQITSYLAKNHSQIVIEDLNVLGMMKNHCLAGAIADVGFYEFGRQLEYKCAWYGSELIVASRWYPSSQLCSSCHHQQSMPLSVRVFKCDRCGFEIDRDLNASINLENYPHTAVG